MSVESNRTSTRHGRRRGVIARASTLTGNARTVPKTVEDVNEKSNINFEKRLLMIKNLKKQFVEDFTNGVSNSDHQKKTRVTSHKHFYASYFTSLQTILRSTKCNFSKERGLVLEGILQDLRCGGKSIRTC